MKLVAAHSLTPEQIKWRRNKKLTPGLIFAQEYPEDIYSAFKHSGVGYFGDTDAHFKAPLGLTPDASHKYIAGLDFGQVHDYTALSIGCVNTKTQVDYLRVNRRSWQEMRDEVRAKCKKWQVRGLYCEENSMGSSQIEALRQEFGRDGLRTAVWSFNMNAATKPPVMAGLRTAIHEGGWQFLDLDFQRHEFNQAVSKQTSRGWTVESIRDQDGGHGDLVIANALMIAMSGQV